MVVPHQRLLHVTGNWAASTVWLEPKYSGRMAPSVQHRPAQIGPPKTVVQAAILPDFQQSMFVAAAAHGILAPATVVDVDPMQGMALQPVEVSQFDRQVACPSICSQPYDQPWGFPNSHVACQHAYKH